MCAINMNNGACVFERTYNRWIINDPRKKLSFDAEGRCIFHSADKAWRRSTKIGTYLEEYIKECINDDLCEQIILDNIKVDSDEKKTVIDFSYLSINKPIHVRSCIVSCSLYFKNTSFENLTEFYKVTFEGDVYFNKAKFKKRTFINNCKFQRPVFFNDVVFESAEREDYVTFTLSEFKEQANFSDTKFLGKTTDVNFQLVKFGQNVYFTAAIFERHAIFNGSKFNGLCDFRLAEFTGGALFNLRVQNEKQDQVYFKAVNFSQTKLKKNIEFRYAEMGEANFAEAIVEDELLFENALFLESKFDSIKVSSKGRIIFKGKFANKVFSKPTSFFVSEQDVNGYIKFENVKVSSVLSEHVKILKDLEKNGAVIFDKDCELEPNVRILTYEITGGRTNYEVVEKIFHGLENWVRKFTNNVNAFLHTDSVNFLRSEFRLVVCWKYDYDYDLFVNLSKYYFECLDSNSDSVTSKLLKELSRKYFTQTFFGAQGYNFDEIRPDLELILDEIRNFIHLKSNNLALDHSEVNSVLILDKKMDPMYKAAIIEIVNLIGSDLSDRNSMLADSGNLKITTLNRESIKGITTNFFITMNQDNKIENSGTINGPVLAGSTVTGNVNNTFSNEMVDFGLLNQDLEKLFAWALENKEMGVSKEEIANIVLAIDAVKRKDETAFTEKIKAIGLWVLDAAKQVGAGYLSGWLLK